MKRINIDDYVDIETAPLNLNDGGLGYRGEGIDLTHFLADIREYILKQPEKLIVTIERTKEQGHYNTVIYISKENFGGGVGIYLPIHRGYNNDSKM